MTKSFLIMLVAFVVLGGSLGGAFVGGVALGKSQSGDSPAESSPLRPASGLQQQAGDRSGQGFQLGNASPEDLARLRERFQSGDITPEDLSQIRQQFQSGEATPEDLSQFRQRFGQGSGGRGGLTGPITKVEGNTVTVDTPQGPLQAVINEETVIQKFSAVELADLEAGVQVSVIGQPGEDGPVVARVIFITPEGAGSLFDGSFFSGERPRSDRTGGGGDGFQPN